MILYTNQAQHDHAVKSRGGIVGKKQGGGGGQEDKGKEKKERDEDIHVGSEAYDWLLGQFGLG